MFPELQTPAALVDLDRVERNLARVAAYAKAHQLAWRPHIKTHKTVELAALQLEAGASGITVATAREAEVMAQVAQDVLLAYPPVGSARVERVLNLPRSVRVSTTVDGFEALEALGAAALERSRECGVRVELDLGMRRLGVQSPEQAVALAEAITRYPTLRYEGVFFYPGHLRGPIADAERDVERLSEDLGVYLDALSRSGFRPRVVSGGSTPTLWRSHQVRGLTEIRPGINALNDRNSASIGACSWDECAYSVLATVVSTAVAGQAVIDAGSKALAKEEGFTAGGYGALLDAPDVVVERLSEEHGILDLTHTAWRPRVGDRVRVVPNHVCASVVLHPRLHVLRRGELDGAWEVAAREW